MPIPTRRLLLLTLLGAPLLALGGISAWFFALAVIYLATLVIIVALDLARSPAPGRFRVSREAESKLSLGADNPVVVRVTDPRTSGAPVRLVVRDTAPDEFTPGAVLLPEEIGPRGTVEARYMVPPPRRGDFAFGDTYLRVWSALGLTARQARHATAAAVKVYPN